MFLWNNIFFSLGFDVKDHYKDFGGDAAAYVAPVSLLEALKNSCQWSDVRLIKYHIICTCGFFPNTAFALKNYHQKNYLFIALIIMDLFFKKEKFAMFLFRFLFCRVMTSRA